MRLWQLAGMDPAKIMELTQRLPHYGHKMNIDKKHTVISWERLTTDILKACGLSS